MKTITLHVVGESPLLMHSTKGMTRAGSAKMKAKKVPDAKEEAELAAYRDDDGHLFVPCIFFRQAAVSAGKGRKIGKHFATTLLRGALIDPDRRALLVDPGTGEVLTEYEIDERAVVVGKARVMRARPRLDTWAAGVTLDYDDDVLDPEIIADVLDTAGTRVGVGDYRVEKGGWFGRFRVDSVSVDSTS